MARMFHWVMAASMFVLLFTAFLPIVGVRFAWVQWHWIAGLVLTGSIIYHIIHATFFLDFWSIWVGPKDIPEFKAEMLRELGHDVAGSESRQVSARQPPLSPRDRRRRPGGGRHRHLHDVRGSARRSSRAIPYMLSDDAWGFTYVPHGLAGVGLVGLVIAHVYFAVRPEKWWITKAMIFGWITRRQYLEHHDPQRWNVRTGNKPQPAGRQ